MPLTANKRMRSDQNARYAFILTADAGVMWQVLTVAVL